MAKKSPTLTLLEENLKLARASRTVLQESYDRAGPLLRSKKAELDIGERETLEALTARFARFADFLVQRLFRTLDEHELVAEGTVLDCLNRMEKRGIIPDVQVFREIRQLRNERSDEVVSQAHEKTPLLFQALVAFEDYVRLKKYF